MNRYIGYLSEDNNLNEKNAMTTVFDDVPINTGKKFNFNEYPDGYDPNSEASAAKDEETGPLAVRVKSKVWKTRNNAFEELCKKFEESSANDQIFYEYSSDLPKFIADSHPGAQEKALNTFKIYIEKLNGLGSLDSKDCIKILIDKAIAPGKSNIKKLSLDILCLIFEKSDKSGCFEGLIDSINSKNQKVINNIIYML